MAKHINIEAIAASLFPDHVVANYPRMVDFAKAFFKYLEEENRSSYYQNTLYLQRDIREQDPEFLEYIKRELGFLSRREYAADPKVFYDKIAEIWRSKGSEESIKLFFRVFLNDEVDIFYPWEVVLIPSDGRWIVDTVIRVTSLVGNPEDFAGKRIYQIGSDATAIVDRVDSKVYSDGTIYELKLIPSSISSQFAINSTIYYDETLTAEVYKSLRSLSITTSGTGYAVGDLINILGYQGLTFTAYVHSVNELGGITDISIVDFGTGNTPLSVREGKTSGYYMVDYAIYDYSTGTQVGPNVEINIVSELGANAELQLNFGSIVTYKGRYEGSKGQLSSSIVLQDSRYYQKFSYEVRTSYSADRWIGPLKKFAHPAGMEVIANVASYNVINVGIKSAQIFISLPELPSIVNEETISVTASAVGYTQDYFEALYFAEDYFGTQEFTSV